MNELTDVYDIFMPFHFRFSQQLIILFLNRSSNLWSEGIWHKATIKDGWQPE